MDSRKRSFEARLAASLDDVAVPAGLRERLLDRLRQPESPPVPADAIISPGEPVILPAEPVLSPGEPVSQARAEITLPIAGPQPASGQRFSRRWWIPAAAAAAGLLLAGRLWMLSDGGQTDVTQLAANWQSQLAAPWQPAQTAPSGFGVPRPVAVTAQSWRAIGQLSAPRGVAWDLSRPGFAKAVLFVVRMSCPGLPPSPPAAPQSTTGGQTVAGWQSGGLVYVLVVDGTLQDYRRLVHLSVERVA